MTMVLKAVGGLAGLFEAVALRAVALICSQLEPHVLMAKQDLEAREDHLWRGVTRRT